ncbi:MAG: hypothetical protein KIS77_00425 [Saprospiraceae bacterium]|nr:hypothetical protein [Saprospiraceae bacterium]
MAALLGDLRGDRLGAAGGDVPRLQIDVVLDGDGPVADGGGEQRQPGQLGASSRKEISRGGAFGQFVYFSCADILPSTGCST